MADIIDVYFDSFQVNMGPWGATLNLSLSGSQPPAPGSQPQSDRVATVRTSLEHLKAMTYILKRHITQFEESSGISVQVPTRVLSAMTIAPEDWDVFWKSGG